MSLRCPKISAKYKTQFLKTIKSNLINMQTHTVIKRPTLNGQPTSEKTHGSFFFELPE